MHDTQNALHRNPLNRQHSKQRREEDDEQKSDNRKKISELKSLEQKWQGWIRKCTNFFLLFGFLLLFWLHQKMNGMDPFFMCSRNFNANIKQRTRERANDNAQRGRRQQQQQHKRQRAPAKKLKSIKFEIRFLPMLCHTQCLIFICVHVLWIDRCMYVTYTQMHARVYVMISFAAKSFFSFCRCCCYWNGKHEAGCVW